METRRRGERLLSDVKIRQAKGPTHLHDGGGLYCEIDERHNKRWILRLSINGKRTRRGLGSYPEVGLGTAREEADQLRRGAAVGRDVRAEDRAQKHRTAAAALTFREYFQQHFESTIRPKLSPKFAPSYYRSVEQLLYPAIGDRPIAEVRPSEIIEALRPIWQSKSERARRVLQRASVAFESAIVHEIRTIGNPTSGVRRELGAGRPRVKHRASLPWQEAPEFLRWLKGRERVSAACRQALQMIIFTGLRSEEVRLAKWGEFDLRAREWRVPGIDHAESERQNFISYQKKRMKMGLDHIVPLSSGALAVLAEAEALRSDASPGALVFLSAANTPLSDNTLSKLLRDGGFKGKASPHGFRATLKTWCAEHGVRDEVSEYILAHADPDLVRKAYRRATYFDERREVLEKWSLYLLGADWS